MTIILSPINISDNIGASISPNPPTVVTLPNANKVVMDNGAVVGDSFARVGTLWVPGLGSVKVLTGSYATNANDVAKLLVFSIAGPATLVLPTPPPFNTWKVSVENIGTGTLSIPSPVGTQIDQAITTILVNSNQGLEIWTDGVNYFTERGMGTGGGGGGSATPASIQNEAYTYWPDTGAANAYVITPVPAITAYAAGQGFQVKFANACTGASTINVSGVGTKAIKKWSAGALVDLANGDVSANQILYLKYDGTVFQVISGVSSGGSTVGTPVENEIVVFTGTAGTLANTPSVIAGYTQVKLYRDGSRLTPGVGNDFTWTGANITLATASAVSTFVADYYK